MTDYRERPPNIFGHEVIDRRGEHRDDPSILSERHPQVRLVPVWRSRSLLHPSGEEPLAVYQDVDHEPPDDAIFLGVHDCHRYFALDLSSEPEPEIGPKGSQWVDLRLVGQLLSDHDAAVLAQARAMCTWHRRHAFCGKCGTRTESEHAGHQRRCGNTDCGYMQFPRTDPAIIVQVSRGDHILLGRQAGWPEDTWSVVAGFVEPGESLEAAVRREVMEETGVRVSNVRYHSSQPWPFPQSIMLGFCADAESEDIDLKDGELEKARWFQRSELLKAVEAGQVRLSRRVSISRRLIDHWLEQTA